MALFAATLDGIRSFERNEWVRRPFRATGLILFCERDLLCTQAFLTIDSRPRYGGMTASQKLLIDPFVTTAAIARSQLRRKSKPVMFLCSLISRRLVAVETCEATPRMGTQLKLMHHGVLQLGVAFRTFPRSACERRTLPADIGDRPPAVDEECTHDEREADYGRNEHSAKLHDLSSQV